MHANLISLGKISKPFGVKGQVKVLPFNPETANLTNIKAVYIGQSSTSASFFQVKSTKLSGKYIVLCLEDINTIDDAELLRNLEVYINKDNLKQTKEDEYYHYDLIGLNVYTEKNLFLGIIKDILNTSGHDILICKNDNKEILIPVVSDFVIKVDLEKKIIIVNLIEGLDEI